LSELVSDVGGSPVLHGTYRFAPSRLNFARAAHLLGVVPPLIRDEIKVLESLSGAIAVDSPFGRVLAELITVKRSGADQLEAMNQANVEARAKAATSGKAAAPASTGGAKSDDPMAFRDADMPLDERMTVVEKQALDMKLWAAMAQTDCTACGYDCEGYAKAIADGTEGDLTKCVPGEDETANVLKKLMSK
ncbi:MAG: hypothetical protein KDB53_10975, partial [Planctomycetes bacterium]|nr:hypothetical protein [Planctomycetota bacterium]